MVRVDERNVTVPVRGKGVLRAETQETLMVERDRIGFRVLAMGANRCTPGDAGAKGSLVGCRKGVRY